jgi:uncharacterized membrane protein YGL010W
MGMRTVFFTITALQQNVRPLVVESNVTYDQGQGFLQSVVVWAETLVHHKTFENRNHAFLEDIHLFTEHRNSKQHQQ